MILSINRRSDVRYRAILLRSILFSLLLIALGSVFLVKGYLGKKSEKENTYVITESDRPNSYDPLEADFLANLPVARMRYLTPIEVSSGDDLSSTVLESFNYDTNNKVVTWIVRSGLTYENGEPITTSDVVLAVTRMLRSRPNFPVIRHIKGKEEWLRAGGHLDTLPSGLIVDGQKIEISLNKDVRNPLFRFTLEIFSIIPSACVDLKTSDLICERPPASGYYEIANGADISSEIRFTKRHGVDHLLKTKVPEKITFLYKRGAFPSDVMLNSSSDDRNLVVATTSFKLVPTEIAKIQNHADIKFLPKSRFVYLYLNLRAPIFREAGCRRLFADTFRKFFQEQSRFDATRSVFPKIIPGHLSDEELYEEYVSASGQECREILSQSAVTFLPSSLTFENPDYFDKAVLSTIDSLGIKLSHFTGKATRENFKQLFVEGKHDIIGAGLGYWPLDPIGDIEMMFTPNMHSHIDTLSSDKHLQELIQRLVNFPIKENFESFNRYLYQNATFNVFHHYNRAYVSNHGNIGRTPMAITSAYPWHLFEE